MFSVGDLVFLYLQPYVHYSLAPRSHHKLCFKYFGPFEIIAKIGSVAYKLALAPGFAIHPVFHISLLKPASTPIKPVSSTLPNPDFTMQIPEQVL